MKLIQFLLLLFVFALLSCGGDETVNKCSTKEDCKSGEVCNDSGVCEAPTSCTHNSQCKGGELCDLTTNTCKETFICYSTQSCYDHDSTWNAETNPVECSQGVCKPKSCKSNTDCSDGKICNLSSGKCEAAQDCSIVDSVKIITPSPVLTQGTEKQLKAVTLNKNGLVIDTGNTFTWASDAEDKVTVNAMGLLTGGNTSGEAHITASVCNKTSESLLVQNFSQLENGKLRLIVRDINENSVSGATVTINGNDATTDNLGSVLLDNAEAKNNIMIKADGFQYVFLPEIAEKDIIVYLNVLNDPSKSGGFKGEFDFNHETIKNNGSMRIGLAGSSMPGSFLDLDFNIPLGEPIQTSLPQIGKLPLPSSAIMMITDFDRSEYMTTALKGERVLWGWGGRTSLATMLPIAGHLIGGEGIDIAKFLADFTPIAETFNHSIKESQTITTCPKVVDTDDINNNEDTTEMVPDFKNANCFPTVNMTLNQPLSQRSTLKFPALPTIEGTKTDATLLVVAGLVEGKGLIPLGLGGAVDKKTDEQTADGQIDDIVLAYAPQHSGLANSDSLVSIITMPFDGSSVGTDTDIRNLRTNMTGVVKLYKNGVIDDTVDFSSTPFLALAEDTKLEGNTLSFTAVPDASFYRLSISKSGTNWLVYTEATTVNLTNDMLSGAEKIYVQAVITKKDTNAITFAQLLTFNDANMNDLARLIKKFSIFQYNIASK